MLVGYYGTEPKCKIRVHKSQAFALVRRFKIVVLQRPRSSSVGKPHIQWDRCKEKRLQFNYSDQVRHQTNYKQLE